MCPMYLKYKTRYCLIETIDWEEELRRVDVMKFDNKEWESPALKTSAQLGMLKYMFEEMAKSLNAVVEMHNKLYTESQEKNDDANE